MTDFDIRAAIREVVETSDLTDPGEIASKVAANVPAKELRGVLTVVLREYVRTALHSFTSWRRPESSQVTSESPKPNRSAKVAAYQAHALEYARLLRQPIAVGDNVWKQFGHCSTDDLEFLSAERRENAAQNLAAAERFEKYAAAMDEHDAETVADLPDAVIASIEDGS